MVTFDKEDWADPNVEKDLEPYALSEIVAAPDGEQVNVHSTSY